MGTNPNPNPNPNPLPLTLILSLPLPLPLPLSLTPTLQELLDGRCGDGLFASLVRHDARGQAWGGARLSKR